MLAAAVLAAADVAVVVTGVLPAGAETAALELEYEYADVVE